ncbi:MAG: 4Fe-4S binding protein [Actinobacteria bacterium]|nr:4Fe-4S binding protein [Actinomycetota bacterium]MBU1942047.1 4Fe-4S binding protein [Actinomycetota bacterium]MBU2687182.1 4Fe-4S binding protein [Actinomycetota bacterium]
MEDEIYHQLREFLDGLPGGMPATPTGVEIGLLERYFSPEEAALFLHLNPYPEAPGAIAERAGMDAGAAATMLESMAKQGSVFRVRFEDQVFYMAMSLLVGIYEFHVGSMDRELAQMLEEYLPYLTDYWADIKTKQLRVVPVAEAVDAMPEVATYDRAREMARGFDDIAVADCICRVEKSLLDQRCSRPLESCLVFGNAARYYIENGIGREIDIDECMRILDRAEEAAMVLCPSNAQDIANICCCCSCCCGMLNALRRVDRPADHALSSFRAAIDPELCVECGTCLERCQIDAIVERDGFMEVDEARCIGCGLCVPTCVEGAASLQAKPGIQAPPANFVEMNARILKERGLA